MTTTGVCGCEAEHWPHNRKVPSSIPGSRCQLWDFHNWYTHLHQYWCSFQDAEFREISISRNNLFLNQYKINMFNSLPRNAAF